MKKLLNHVDETIFYIGHIGMDYPLTSYLVLITINEYRITRVMF